jgi:hypothetical protein
MKAILDFQYTTKYNYEVKAFKVQGTADELADYVKYKTHCPEHHLVLSTKDDDVEFNALTEITLAKVFVNAIEERYVRVK